MKYRRLCIEQMEDRVVLSAALGPAMPHTSIAATMPLPFFDAPTHTIAPTRVDIHTFQSPSTPYRAAGVAVAPAAAEPNTAGFAVRLTPDILVGVTTGLERVADRIGQAETFRGSPRDVLERPSDALQARTPIWYFLSSRNDAVGADSLAVVRFGQSGIHSMPGGPELLPPLLQPTFDLRLASFATLRLSAEIVPADPGQAEHLRTPPPGMFPHDDGRGRSFIRFAESGLTRPTTNTSLAIGMADAGVELQTAGNGLSTNAAGLAADLDIGMPAARLPYGMDSNPFAVAAGSTRTLVGWLARAEQPGATVGTHDGGFIDVDPTLSRNGLPGLQSNVSDGFLSLESKLGRSDDVASEASSTVLRTEAGKREDASLATDSSESQGRPARRFRADELAEEDWPGAEAGDDYLVDGRFAVISSAELAVEESEGGMIDLTGFAGDVVQIDRAVAETSPRQERSAPIGKDELIVEGSRGRSQVFELAMAGRAEAVPSVSGPAQPLAAGDAARASLRPPAEHGVSLRYHAHDEVFAEISQEPENLDAFSAKDDAQLSFGRVSLLGAAIVAMNQLAASKDTRREPVLGLRWRSR